MRTRLTLLTSLWLAGAGGAAHADTWTDLWSTREQQAQKLLDSRHPEAAAPLFNDARRRAYAELQAGQYAKAAKSLAPFKDADSQYNRGNALAHAGQLREALGAYDAALAAAPGDKDVIRNRDLVKQALEQQQNQSGQQGGSKGNPGSQGSKGGQSQGGNNSPGGGQPQPGQSQAQDNKSQQGGQSQANQSQGNQAQAQSQSSQSQQGQQASNQNGQPRADNQGNGSQSQSGGQQSGGQSGNQPGQQPGNSSQAANRAQSANQASQTQPRAQDGSQSSQAGGQAQAANPSQGTNPSQATNPSQSSPPRPGATRSGDNTTGEGALAPNGQQANGSTAAGGLNAENAQQDANAALRYRQSQQARSGSETNPRGTASTLTPDGKSSSSTEVPPPKPPSEQSMALDQWLRGIPDDSAELLRRKFLIEHMLKQQRNEQ